MVSTYQFIRRACAYVLACLLAIALSIVFLLPLNIAYAATESFQPSSVNPNSMAIKTLQVAPGQVVRVGFFKYDGYHDINENGSMDGYGYSLLHMMRPYTNWDYEYIGYDKSWSEIQDMLEAGGVDLVTSAQKTPSREARFDFSDRPIGTSSTVLTIKSGDARYSIEDYSTLDGIRVGMVEGSSRNDSFDEYAQVHGFDYVPVYYSDVEKLAEALQEGSDIDAIVTSNLRVMNNEFILDQFDASDFYVMVQKGNDELLNQVNNAIAQMDVVNPQWRSELWNSYYTPTSGDSINLTPSEDAYLKSLASQGVILSVLVNPDKNPYAYVENGRYAGIIPDIFTEIANRVGLRFAFLPVSTMQDYQRLKANPATDLVIDLPNNVYQAEQESYILTDPYIDMEIDRLSRKDAPKQPRIAAVRDSYSYEKYGDAWQKEGEVVFYSNFDECAQAVLKDVCDVSYLYAYQAQRTMNTDERNQLVLSSVTGEQMQLCIGVSDRFDHRLASILDKSIASVKSAYVTQTVQEHTVNMRRDFTFIGFIYDNPLFVIVALLVMAGIVVLLVMGNNRRKRMIAMQKHATELEQNRAIIEDALTRAESANRAKTTFLNSMSHDIRTPMNAIMGFASLAAAHSDDKARVADYLRKIMTSSNHLLSLINDVLDMSRIESGKMTIDEQECHLPDILHDLRSILQADVKAKRLRFFIDTVDVTSENVVCDKLRLTQVLLNCIGNAVKYTEPGGTIGIRVIQKPVQLAGFAHFDFVVADTGIGMSKDFVQHIFEPFTREETATVSGIQGTGLGMSITKNIVDMMGGTISIESELGKGTEITIGLTLQVSSNTQAPVWELTQFKGTRALVVDDFMDTCANVSRMLSTIGLRADWTTSGKEAVFKTQCALEDADPFAVFIIDWLIPDMNGIEVTRRIRATMGADVPIVILTAYDWSEIEDEAREAGVTAFCPKPVFMSELHDVLARVSEGTSLYSAPEFDRLSDFSGHRILLVEDNMLNREIATDLLEEANIAVEHAEDGQKALEQLLSHDPHHYDLVLMDIQMPHMNGYEATRAIRAFDNPALANIPIVAMTADAFEEARQEAMKSGMNGHIAKPIEIPVLMEELARIFAEQL